MFYVPVEVKVKNDFIKFKNVKKTGSQKSLKKISSKKLNEVHR